MDARNGQQNLCKKGGKMISVIGIYLLGVVVSYVLVMYDIKKRNVKIESSDVGACFLSWLLVLLGGSMMLTSMIVDKSNEMLGKFENDRIAQMINDTQPIVNFIEMYDDGLFKDRTTLLDYTMNDAKRAVNKLCKSEVL